MGVGRQRSRAGTEDQATLALVVQLDQSLGDHEGVVIRKGNHARAEPDAMGSLGRGGQEEFRGGDHLPAGGVVFTAPELVETQAVEVLNEVEIAAQLQRRVLADGVVGREEGAEFHVAHWMNSRRDDACVRPCFA